MDNISLETQGIKGGKTNKTTPLGSIQSFLRHESDFIFIDDFEGYGNSYKQRELTKITIVQNGNVLFSGDKYELFELLKKSI